MDRHAAATYDVLYRLTQQGFDVANVEGGMRAWQGAGKPLEGEHGDPFVL